MQIIEAEKKAFTEFSKEQLDTLEKAIQIVEPNAFVSKVDYAKGSVPAAFYDVFTRAYERFI